jgi:hypothetical protein
MDPTANKPALMSADKAGYLAKPIRGHFLAGVSILFEWGKIKT